MRVKSDAFQNFEGFSAASLQQMTEREGNKAMVWLQKKKLKEAKDKTMVIKPSGRFTESGAIV